MWEWGTHKKVKSADTSDTVDLVMALEEKFDIEITDEEAETMQTVGAAIRLICEKTATTVQG